jgi:hypothetical protein
MIICSIWTLPVPPKLPTPSPPRRLIPVELVEAFASLFNDPAYSDVVFEIRWKGKKRVGGKGDKQDGGVRRLYASRKVLCGRSDYFDTSAFPFCHIGVASSFGFITSLVLICPYCSV